ncbi:MAG: hypothetical protein AAGD35_11805 [Actinomycetota bacterium]
MTRFVHPPQLLVAVAASALLLAAISWLPSSDPPGALLDVSAADAEIVAQASAPVEAPAAPLPLPEPSVQPASLPANDDAAAAVPAAAETAPAPAPADAPAAAPASDAPAEAEADSQAAAPAPAAASESAATEAPAAPVTAAPAPSTTAAPQPAPADNRSSGPELAVGSIKSKADDKGYDVHGHVEHSVVLLGQQVLIPGQAATGGFVKQDENTYLAYSPVTAMLPVAIQDNKEVLKKKPNLSGEKLYRRLAQEYTGSNDYKNLAPDAQRAINILTCTDWSTVKKKVRENTINHLLHSPISFGTIGSVDDPISTDVTIDLGYTHTRDKNWTEVEYMGNNVYKVTVVSNNNNGSHTGHEMGTAYVEMPAGTSLRQAQKIGNRMIPSTNKNNKLTIDPAAKNLFESLPKGASPMILFEHLSEAEQNAYFEGRGIETVGKPNPDCNPLKGGILGSGPAPADPAPAETPDAPAETPAKDDEAVETPVDDAPSDDAATGTEETPAETADETSGDTAEDTTAADPPPEPEPPADEESTTALPVETPAADDGGAATTDASDAESGGTDAGDGGDQAAPDPSADSG